MLPEVNRRYLEELAEAAQNAGLTPEQFATAISEDATLTGVTANAAELNILDGATLTTAELNRVGGVTSAIQTQLNAKAASSHTHNLADVTDVNATAAEVNKLAGTPAGLTATELGYVDGVTSAIQPQLDSKANTSHSHAASDITSGTIAQSRLGTGSGGAGTKFLADDQTYKTPTAGVDTANSPAAGEWAKFTDADTIEGRTSAELVDDLVSGLTLTELGYVNGVTSAIQTQIDGKSATGHTHLLANVTDVTATAAELNKLAGTPAGLTATELGYVDGVTSAIQTQLDGKAASSHAHAASDITSGTIDQARLGTGSGGAGTKVLYDDQTFKTPAAGGVDTANSPNANEFARFTDADTIEGRTAAELIDDLVSGLSLTELGHLNGVTSAIQTQLDAKAPLSSPALTGTPTAPTAAAGTNTTQIATTAFVLANPSAGAVICILQRATDFVKGSGGWEPFEWDQAFFDPDSLYDSGNKDRIPLPAAGKYLLSFYSGGDAFGITSNFTAGTNEPQIYLGDINGTFLGYWSGYDNTYSNPKRFLDLLVTAGSAGFVNLYLNTATTIYADPSYGQHPHVIVRRLS